MSECTLVARDCHGNKLPRNDYKEEKRLRDFYDISILMNAPEYIFISRLKKNILERKRKKRFKRNVKEFVKGL